MADEPIGSVSVNITGDYAQLGKDFDAAVAMAVEKGSTLAEAINQALAQIDASKVTTGIESIGVASQQASGAIESAAEQLNLFGEAADQIPFADANGQLNLFTTDLDDFTTGISAAAAMTEEMNQTAEDFTKGITQSAEAAEAAGEASKRGAEGSGELLKTLLEFTGIEITFEAIKEAITEMVEVFATVEKASISLTALSGSAEEAEATIERLKNQAMATATPFLELVQAQQKLTAAFVDNEAAYTQIPGVLHAASEAAAATGGSFATAANAIERIGLSGMVSGRMLVSLGLSADELAAKIGVATEDIAKAFKQMDPSERIQYIVEALGKFEGTAEAVASGVAGQMQRLKTEWEFLLEDMGKALAPLASQWIRFVDDVIKNLDMLAVDLQKAVPIFKDWQEAGVTAVDLVATAINVRLGGALAIIQAVNAFFSLQRSLQDAAKAGQDADNAFARLVTTVNQLIPSTGQFRDTFRQLNDEYHRTGDQAAYQNGLRSLMDAFHQSTGFVAAATEEHKKFALVLKEVFEKSYTVSHGYDDIFASEDKLRQSIERFNIALSEHTTILPKVGETLTEYRERIKSLGDNDLPVLTASVANLNKELKAADEPMKLLDVDMRALNQQSRETLQPLTDVQNALKLLGLGGRHDIDNLISAVQLLDAAWANDETKVDELARAHNRLTVAIEKDTLRTYDEMMQAGDKMTLAQEADYARIKFAIQANEAEARAFDTILNTVSNDVTAGLVGIIDGTETVGQAFHQLALDILKDCLDVIIKQGINAVINALGGIGGIISGIGGIFGSIFGFAEGGDVPHDMIAKVHAGERVLNPDEAKAYRQLISQPFEANVMPGVFAAPSDYSSSSYSSNVSSSGPVTINAHFHGHPRDNAKELAKLLKVSSPAFTF